jgi:hypothetical protein
MLRYTKFQCCVTFQFKIFASFLGKIEEVKLQCEEEFPQENLLLVSFWKTGMEKQTKLGKQIAKHLLQIFVCKFLILLNFER